MTKKVTKRGGKRKGAGPRDVTASRSALDNVGRMSVIAATVSSYDHLTDLPGADRDADQVERLFATNKDVALFDGSSRFLREPTATELREAITDYVVDRSARGDILLFYFSGHGSIVGGPGNEFGFCARDTRKREDGGVLPLTVVNFRDVVRTLAMVDVHPVFIIDACFASAIGGSMHDDLQRHLGGCYAFLCSSYEATESLDFQDGGAFTKALVESCLDGRSDDAGKRQKCLTLGDLARKVRGRLEQQGHPLSRCHIGPDLPEIAVARNVRYKPNRVGLSADLIKLVKWLYNSGCPRPIEKSRITAVVSNGAYCNHNKLSYRPWGLLKDGKARHTRELSAKGIRFAEGAVSVPRHIEQDPITQEWHPAPNTTQTSIS